MAPTVLKIKNYRFFFNSREESRKHIHIVSTEGTAKFWLEPIVSLADFYHLSDKELNEIKKIADERKNEFIDEWNKHFGL